jgi:hypothetical protein
MVRRRGALEEQLDLLVWSEILLRADPHRADAVLPVRRATLDVEEGPGMCER